jgi:excisionase family DNA binding protein
MSEYAGRPNLPDYVSIKEAAKMLGISDKRVYEYVDAGRLKSMWAADVIMIPIEDVKQFQRRSSGRPRKNVPIWRSSSGDNTQFTTTITVQVLPGQQDMLLQRLDTIRQKSQYTFPGTVARFVIESQTIPDQIEIALIWRRTIMPNTTELEDALEAFRQALADVLDWQTAQYNNGKVLIHT